MYKEKILIATGIYPPSVGGTATHAKKVFSYFKQKKYEVSLFVFQDLMNYPPVVRHILAFMCLVRALFKVHTCFIFDNFSVALPTIFAAKIWRTNCVMRIGGDFVYEQYVEKTGARVDLETFYKGKLWNSGGITLKVKFLLMKYVIENARTRFFTTTWQKEIYDSFFTYNSDNDIVIANPRESKSELLLTANSKEVGDKLEKKITFIASCRDIKLKNLSMVKSVVSNLNKKNYLISLDTNNYSPNEFIKKVNEGYVYVCMSYSDISPNSVLEALSLGKPVILTKYTGFHADFLNFEGVLLADPFNSNSLEQAMEKLLSPDYYEKAIKAIKNWQWPHTWGSVLSKYEKYLEKS